MRHGQKGRERPILSHRGPGRRGRSPPRLSRGGQADWRRSLFPSGKVAGGRIAGKSIKTMFLYPIMPVAPSPLPVGTPTRTPAPQPIPQPRPAPRPIPVPRPVPAPSPVGPAVVVTVLDLVRACAFPVDGFRAVRTKKHQTSAESPRQSPCPGQRGERKVTYRDRWRVLGFVASGKGGIIGPMPKRQADFVLSEAKRLARRQGYDPSRDGNEVKVDLVDRAEAMAHPKRNPLLSDLTAECFYKVSIKERRRVCKCPDGSPCRSTRKRPHPDKLPKLRRLVDWLFR